MATQVKFENLTGPMASTSVYTAGTTDEILAVSIAYEYTSSVNILTSYQDEKGSQEEASFDQPALHTFNIKVKSGTDVSMHTNCGPSENYSFYVNIEKLMDA